MSINPILIAQEIEDRFRRYLLTTFDFPEGYADLRDQFRQALMTPARLFRGPYLHGLAPYVCDVSVKDLIDKKVLPADVRRLPLLEPVTRPLYRHQSRAIERIQEGHNIVVSSGTGSGKTLTFLTPIIAEILRNPAPGVHALLLYPMNALVNDQLKNLRRILRGVPEVRFGRYINVHVTPDKEKDGRRLHPEAPANEVVSRDIFRTNPPHILVTNYAMLEYLLLRVDDSPLFQGPWRFIVVDEAHTYAGAKGSEVALLLRRLRSRVKQPDESPPQCIATSATLGIADAKHRQEVLEFAHKLFDAPFAKEDLILADKEHIPAEGGCEPDPAVYTDPTLLKACSPGAVWSSELTNLLKRAGFPVETVNESAKEGAKSVEEGLYQVFRRDGRTLRLREAADVPRDLPSAAEIVLGGRDEASVEQLCGLVRVCSFARMPGGDARLVPCRYHLFTRGLNGAYVALNNEDGEIATRLFLDPVNATPDGTASTLELRSCRKCGQPYLFGYRVTVHDRNVLRAFGTEREDRVDRGRPLWLTWEAPKPRSEDEAEETEDSVGRFPIIGYKPETGEFRDLPDGKPGEKEVALWRIHEKADLNRCFACGGQETITPIRADAAAAQAVVADAFYRCLPPATSPPAKPEALDYPGQGRKLLAFADSRQSAAYFAPYFQNSNREQLMRRLIYDGLRRAEAKLEVVDADSLISFMMREAEDTRLFPVNWSGGQRREECLRAVVREFCLPFGRRQSLEALALVACRAALKNRWTPPQELLTLLTPEEATSVTQVLLSTVRLLKAVELPDPLTVNDPIFRVRKGHDAFKAQGSTEEKKGYRLHGFAPERAPRLQRRGLFLKRTLEAAAKRRGCPLPSDADVRKILDRIWTSLLGGARPLLRKATIATGIVGHQLRWEDLCFTSGGKWYSCPECQQWSAHEVLGVCPSFRCGGTLEAADPNERLAMNHYRRILSIPGDGPVPATACEHTAQLGAKLATEYQVAFQDGHQPESDVGQINMLSCSTTFELGVDLGDLEAVFLRNVPPSPANYQQRAGRAGRGIGSAAFAVTFAMPRSHDEHYFTQPIQMIDGLIRPPRIDLRNETIYSRHVNAVLLADFVRSWQASQKETITGIGQMLTARGASQPTPFDVFLEGLPKAIRENSYAIDGLIPGGNCLARVDALAEQIRKAFREAADYFADEIKMYDAAIAEVEQRWKQAEQNGKHDVAKRLYGFRGFLYSRRNDLQTTDWVDFFSDRSVLPSYAFPIYNVTLATADSELKLERDLRIALSEYVPGAAIVAKGKLWRSVGIRRPWQKSLERKYYACCPQCWHVIRHLDSDEVFPDGLCPVCKHDGQYPVRRKHAYLVPSHGFTTDLTVNGEDLAFDRPERIPASRVMFVPQQQANDPVRASLGTGAARIEVRTTEKAEFFVFNDGDDPSGVGFHLCKLCDRQVTLDKNRRPEPHKTPLGKDCPGTSYDTVHLGHDFISCAARLMFFGTNESYTARGFWLSLLYALLGGMSDALGIEDGDINGVIRPIDLGDGVVGQEVVVFDDVPGGAGHSLRLEGEGELLGVLNAAHARVANCACGESAACYACLRSYRNQFCHDLLARGPVADYLNRLIESVSRNPEDDRLYELPDRTGVVRAALRDNTRVDLVASCLTDSGPPETSPWYVQLLEFASRANTRLRLVLAELPSVRSTAEVAPLLALLQAGAELYCLKSVALSPAYSLLAVTEEETAKNRWIAMRWSQDGKAVPLDGETLRRPIWINRNANRLRAAAAEADKWLQLSTELLSLRDLLPVGDDCIVHAVGKNQPVGFQRILGSLAKEKIISVVLQDPYLLTQHQIKCLANFLAAIPWQRVSGKVPFRLLTHLSDSDPRNRDQLTTSRQQQEIAKCLATLSHLEPKVEYRSKKYAPLHMRYAYFTLEEGGQRIFLFERGLDMEDPWTGKSRGNSYVLEFADLPNALKGILVK
jgi:hypothetical protein